MSNTFTKIYLHIVFAVKNRESLIPVTRQDEIHSYIAGTLKGLGHTPYKIGGTDTHIHIVLGYNIKQLIPDLVREIKKASTKFINESHMIPFKFNWQRGYGCFSASPSHLNQLCDYVEHQYEHHKNISFHDEMKRILDKYDIIFDESYIFDDEF